MGSMVGCFCGGLPAHDHYMGQEQDRNGSWGPKWGGSLDIGRVWVDWRAVAKAFFSMDGPQ